MLTIKNLQLAYGKNTLLNNANVQLYKGQTVGLIGQNGAGKTSLFKLILGQLVPEAGDFSLTNDTLIAYVEQEIHNQEELLVEYVLNAHPLIIHDHSDLPEYYQLRPRAEKLLMNLGFAIEELYLPIGHFSGGWQMRANLAKALFVPSDLLLLDEPTNHLDIETVMWLEDWLKEYQGLAIIISHDREFLDNVTSHTLTISGKTLTLYTGNYTTFENTRYQQIQQQQQMHAKTTAKLAHLQSFVDRFRAGTKAKQAQSRVKMIEKLQVAAAIPKDIEFSIQFLEPEYTVNKLLSIHEANIGYPDKLLINQAKLDIFQESKIGLLGKNGVGKSTFIKALLDKSTLLNGTIEINNKIKIGYFAQNTVDQLELTDTPLNFLSRQHKTKKEQELRSFLGGYGFVGDKVKEKIATFSGGEKARLTIASIILNRPNILFLDEPTNHLDMQMREELANSIQDFNGAVIIVSHDKFLLQSIVDEFYLIDNHQLNPFSGNLYDYHEFLLTKTSKDKPKAEAKPIKQKSILKNPLKIQSDMQKTEDQIIRITSKIEELEKLIGNLDMTFSENASLLNKFTTDYNAAKTKLAALETQWLELETQL
ncbi:MAG: ATP-binding cassette domain-containing protein [Burkholderiales bacterium]|nr:ATP-binding cassette domain-containing protein [Burkholderiales bacterium]